MTCRRCGQPVVWIERLAFYGHAVNPAGKHHYVRPVPASTPDADLNASADRPVVVGAPGARSLGRGQGRSQPARVG